MRGRTRPAWVDEAAYPFADRWLELPGEGTLHYLDERPAGKAAGTLVFVHGTPTWSFEWRHLVAALRDTHRCLAPDHLGFGLSDRPTHADYSPEAHARRFRSWLESVDVSDVTLVVHDFGGPIGLPVLFEPARRAHRLIVLNSWMWSFRGDPGMERKARLASGRLGRWMYRRLNASLRLVMPSAYGARKKLTPAIHQQYLAPFSDPDSRDRVLWALARALLGSADHYQRLWDGRSGLDGLPAMVIWGREDSAFPPHYLKRWREALPTAEVVELETAGHWPHEEEPALVVGAMRRFLRENRG